MICKETGMAIGSDDTPNPSPIFERVITLNGNRVDARDLFHGTSEVVISHGKDRYRLRLTPENELILSNLKNQNSS